MTHRFAHVLWQAGRRDFALYLQSQSSRVFTMDIHPAARIGVGLMLDHGHSIVFGETCVIGDNVSILHEVTLGGTGKETGDRHPKIGDNVLIGAGAKVLGSITIGSCSRIAAGSVVLKDVPAYKTVAGVPAEIIVGMPFARNRRGRWSTVSRLGGRHGMARWLGGARCSAEREALARAGLDALAFCCIKRLGIGCRAPLRSGLRRHGGPHKNTKMMEQAIELER